MSEVLSKTLHGDFDSVFIVKLASTYSPVPELKDLRLLEMHSLLERRLFEFLIKTVVLTLKAPAQYLVKCSYIPFWKKN